MTPDEKEEIARMIGQHFAFCDNMGAMNCGEFARLCRKAADAISERRDHLVKNLQKQIEDAEFALKLYDQGDNSEYWLRHHPGRT